MNRTFTMMSVVALLVAGCGSSGDNGDGGGGAGGNGSGDLSAAAGSDLSMTLPPDMQPAYGCHALDACISACTSNTCAGQCAASSTMNAQMLYFALRGCQRRECFPVPDGGPAPCMKGGGTPTPACTMCQADILKMAGTCNGDTMYCGACYSQYSACQADLP
jgi:hypothetical protein